MYEKGCYKRERDQYGNVIRTVRYLKNGIEENQYIYDSKGRLTNESWHNTYNDSTGEVSYYHQYKKINEHQYAYTLINPERSQYQWELSEIDETSATVDIWEDITTPEVVKEIYHYVIGYKPTIRWIYLMIYETDTQTYFKEIEQLTTAYKEQKGVEFTLTW